MITLLLLIIIICIIFPPALIVVIPLVIMMIAVNGIGVFLGVGAAIVNGIARKVSEEKHGGEG